MRLHPIPSVLIALLATISAHAVSTSVLPETTLPNLPASILPMLARPATPVPIRIAAQNVLFHQQFEDDLKLSPETATSYGREEGNALLDHRSLAASARQNVLDLAYRDRLAGIAADGFPEQDRISHDLLLHVLNQRLADFSLKTYEMPLSQMTGVHTELADLPNAAPLDSVKHYEDYLARLGQIPRALNETIEVLRQGEKDHLMPVRFLLEQVPEQCRGTIAEDPFLEPTRHFPPGISAADQQRLTAAIVATVNTDVLPAYRRFAEFIETEYAPHGRTDIGVSSLPDGARRYRNAIREQTSTTMTAAEVHALGLREVARISGLLNDLAHKQGYPDVQSYRTALRADPKYKPKSADAIVEDFRRYIAQMEPRLPELFGYVPHAPLTVEAVPASQPGNGTHYVLGSPDGRRPGRIVVATANFEHRTLFGDETIAYHEGVPGHHLQNTVQLGLTGLPEFRLHLIDNAYAEGWAVYAEALGKEIGFFQDPASDYGRLATELMRAVRLVIDPGIHTEGWSRDRAVAYFRESGAADEPLIQAEVDRYIAWPAQSLGYKIGQLKIRELRERARQQLGPNFDLRRFHDEVLGGGNLPLDMLEAHVDRWIAGQHPTRASAAGPASQQNSQRGSQQGSRSISSN